MNHDSDEDPEEETPVLRTPRGAAPRGLRTDRFEAFGVQSKAAFSPPGERSEAAIEPLPRQMGPAEPLEWDFAMPGSRAVEPEKSALIEPDVNERNTAGPLRGIKEDIVPAVAKEKFNDNWQRLASEPRARRRTPRKRSRPWYLGADGRLNLRILMKPALVVLLGVVTIVVARKVLEPPPVPLPAAPNGK